MLGRFAAPVLGLVAITKISQAATGGIIDPDCTRFEIPFEAGPAAATDTPMLLALSGALLLARRFGRALPVVLLGLVGRAAGQ